MTAEPELSVAECTEGLQEDLEVEIIYKNEIILVHQLYFVY